VVPFSDVPVASAVVTRPTDTTTARSAITAAVRAPSRQQWSLIGGAALALILLIVVVASFGGDDDAEAEAEPLDTAVVALPAAAPPPVPTDTQPKRATTMRAPKAKKPAVSSKRTDKTTRTPASVGQAVDLEELPVLSADATAASSARSGTTTHRRAAPKPAAKTDGNIFNQAKNLAQKRATQRSGTVKTGSGD